jgi:hypothetical protein
MEMQIIIEDNNPVVAKLPRVKKYKHAIIIQKQTIM